MTLSKTFVGNSIEVQFISYTIKFIRNSFFSLPRTPDLSTFLISRSVFISECCYSIITTNSCFYPIFISIKSNFTTIPLNYPLTVFFTILSATPLGNPLSGSFSDIFLLLYFFVKTLSDVISMFLQPLWLTSEKTFFS